MLGNHDVLVRRAEIRVVAPDGESATEALHAAEPAWRAALQSLSDALGDEVVILRDLDLRMALRTDGDRVPRSQLQRHIESWIGRRIVEARTHVAAHITPETAWFPNEAACVAAYLQALAEGRAGTWPFTSLRSLGSSVPEVLSQYLVREHLVLGGLLAELARASGPANLLDVIPQALARSIVQRWAPQSEAQALDPDALPRDVRLRLGSFASERKSNDDPRGRLRLLAQLLSDWPPARALSVSEACLDTLAGRRPEADTLSSTAGGLIAWSVLLEASGIGEGLWRAYSDERARTAARLVIGCALGNVASRAPDPILMVWAGEAVGARLNMHALLAEASPEPLHSASLLEARRRGWLDGILQVFALGDQFAVQGSMGICVDTVLAASTHDAVQPAVSAYVRRAGTAPGEVEPLPDAPRSALDAIHEVDVSWLPEDWRSAARCAASVLRCALLHEWRLRLPALRGWQATVDRAVEPYAVSLKTRDVRPVPASLHGEHRVGGRLLRVFAG